ncbi:MAG: hypothetical protein VKL39_17330 [Leptolyngbyaceae bacterium]|nr:hypothetical protein [Leptolyngbyaceae bacterium]
MLWLRSTVQEFFSSVNWENRPLQVVDSQDLFSNHAEPDAAPGGTAKPLLKLDMKLSVNQFFDIFPWEGQPAIAEPISLTDLPLGDDTVDDEVTLDDFFGGL